jgi:hypothetical protein
MLQVGQITSDSQVIYEAIPKTFSSIGTSHFPQTTVSSVKNRFLERSCANTRPASSWIPPAHRISSRHAAKLLPKSKRTSQAPFIPVCTTNRIRRSSLVPGIELEQIKLLELKIAIFDLPREDRTAKAMPPVICLQCREEFE